MNDCSGTHRTWFLGNEEIAVIESPVPDGIFRLGDGKHFCMCGGILQCLDLIVGTRNDSASPGDYRTDWNFLGQIRFFRLPKRLAHEEGVALEIDEGLFHAVLIFCYRLSGRSVTS
jgi:hypothetical protein